MKRFLIITLAFVLLIMAACAPQPSESAIQTAISLTDSAQSTATAPPTITFTPNPTSTFTPTQTVTATPTATHTATPTPKLITKQDLEKALLTLEDLPAGWTKSPPDDQGEDKPTFTFLCKEYPKNAIEKVDADFQMSQVAPFLLSSIALYPQEEAKQMFEDMRATVDDCGEFQVTANDTAMTYKVASMSFPKMGDESFAIRVSTESFLGFIEIDSVYFRVGDAIASIQYMTIGLEPIDSSQTEAFAKLVEQKLIVTFR